MGDRKHGVLGSRDAASDGPPTPGLGSERESEPVQAYEEDWYRSLRALAERQQGLAETSVEPADVGDLEQADAGDLEPADDVGDLEPADVGDPEGAWEHAATHARAEEVGVGDVAELEAGDVAEVGVGDVAELETRDVAELELEGSRPEAEPQAEAVDEAQVELEAGTERAFDKEVDPNPARAGTDPFAELTEPETSIPDPERVEREARGAGEEASSEVDGARPEPAELASSQEIDDAFDDLVARELGALTTDEPAEPAGPSLASTDPNERRRALEDLAMHDLSDTDAERVAALLFDPDAEIRRQALEILGRRPERVEDASLLQALQDPSDEVRAAAVELAVRREPRDLQSLVPLLSARAWPLTHRTVLDRLPEVVASSSVDDDMLGRVLEAVGQLEPRPNDEERPALSRLAHALGIRRILGSLAGPDDRRLGAVRLLSDDRSPAVLRALASQGGDPVEEIRRAAAAAITELAETQVEAPRAQAPSDHDEPAEEEAERIASLARALQDDDGTVRHLALSGLAGMDRSAIVAWVHDTIRGGDASQRALAASTAQILRLIEGAADILDAAAELPADARHNLVEALTSFVLPPDQLAGLLGQVREPVRAEAIRMLWRVGGSPLLPHLRGYLDDPSDQVRMAVLEAFGDSGDATAAGVAEAVLERDLSPDVRARAVRVLAAASGAPTAATVVRALSDPDPDVRAIAIEALPDAGGPEAVEVLVSSLSDPDDRVRKAAARRLASRGDDPELVWSALQAAPPAGRGEIIGSFERARPGSITQVALKRLRSPEEDERVLAVEVTGWGASPGCLEGAIQALQDPVARVRRAAAEALGRLREPAAAKALGKALGDPDPEVRVGVVRALGVIDDEGVLGFLVSALNDPDPRVREVTSQVLTEWSSPAVAKRLAGVLAVPSLREAATDLLTRIGPPAVELLIEVLLQHNPAVAPTVGQLLQRIADPGEFVSRLEAVEPERRLRGVEALGAIGGPEAADALLRSVADPDERIRVRAAQLLADLRDPRARDVLATLARDPVPGVVAAAQEALGRLGADGDQAA